MAKRFSDTEMSNDPWYRKLPLEGKVFWRYLLDRCDAAGFWKKDYELSSFQCGFEMTDEILSKINDGKERVKNHGEHLEVVEFVSFQYGVLKADVKPHMPAIRLQKLYENKGYLKGIHTLKDKEQDKDKEKDKEEGSVRGKFEIPTVEEVKAYCFERKNGVDAQQFCDFYASKGWKVGNQVMKDWQAAVRTWEKRNGKEPPPKKICISCKKDASGGWIQTSGGPMCTECNGLPRSNTYRAMAAGAVKQMPK